MDTIALTSPLRLPCGAVLPNRLLKSAMTEGLADEHDRPTPALAHLYQRWAEGGVGTLISGNVLVDHRYLERPGNVVATDDSVLPGLTAMAEAVAPYGAQLWMQINHSGRQTSRLASSRPVAPSEVPLRLGGLFARPRALTEPEILDVVERFGRAADLARRAGFTGVQVHSAHGYLLSQFLSGRTNRRTDRWGGSLENRARLLRAVVARVRETAGPAFPVAVKLNSSDFQRGGFSHADAIQVARWLGEDGIDLLEISGGTYENPRLLGVGDDADERPQASSTRAREAYFLEYAAAIREAVGVPLAVTGGFRTRAVMDQALAEGALDVVGLARPLCVAPAAARGLLEGSALPLPDDERHLHLGPGWLGPASPSRTVRALNAQAGTAWYYQHILALAADRPLDLSTSAAGALARHFAREARLAGRRHRAGTPTNSPPSPPTR